MYDGSTFEYLGPFSENFRGSPLDTAKDTDGNIYISDAKNENPSLQVFDSHLNHLFTFDHPYIRPGIIAINSQGEFFDGIGRRFNLADGTITHFPASAPNLVDFAFDSNDNLYALRNEKDINAPLRDITVTKFDSDGNLIGSIFHLESTERLSATRLKVIDDSIFVDSRLNADSTIHQLTLDGEEINSWDFPNAGVTAIGYFDPSITRTTTDAITPNGDINGDGITDVRDIDLLAEKIWGGDTNTALDLNDDGRIDFDDRLFLFRNILGTRFGDTNLDGEFNTDDLLTVFKAGQYQDDIPGNSTWATGDWTGDGDFNSSDLVQALIAGHPQSVAVPEPPVSFIAFLLLPLLRLRK